MAIERMPAMFGGQRRAPGGGFGHARMPRVQLRAEEPSEAGRASEWTALQRKRTINGACMTVSRRTQYDECVRQQHVARMSSRRTSTVLNAEMLCGEAGRLETPEPIGTYASQSAKQH